MGATSGDIGCRRERHTPQPEALRLVYQPRVDLRTLRASSFEALLRWTHPLRGDVMPDDFLPRAEASGQILEIGAWVLDAAVRQVAHWRRCGLTRTVSINVSPQQIDSGTLPGQLSAALARHRVAADAVEIEVTEGSAVRDVEAATAAMHGVQAIGARLAIDDFGKGYAGIRTLFWLPAKTVKIDKSLVDRLRDGDSGEAARLLKAVLAFAHALGATVVAEGVETIAQLVVLRSMGCDHVQGFVMSPPVESDQLRDDYAAVWQERLLAA
jgi:EAL domain-containing protein (putative c-di-GMP-specific phosphodiesterase class I)